MYINLYIFCIRIFVLESANESEQSPTDIPLGVHICDKCHKILMT